MAQYHVEVVDNVDQKPHDIVAPHLSEAERRYELAEARAEAHSHPHKHGHDPSLPPNHPINALSPLRKFVILCVLSYSGFLANCSVAIIAIAFPPLAKTFDVPVPKIPSTIGYNLLGLGVGPLIWNPLSKTTGRRPVYVIGSFLFLPCVVWMALSKTYVPFAVARVISGVVSSFSQTVPPATIADIFVKEVRGDKMSMFGVAVVIAPGIAPLFCGLILDKYAWPNLFWLILGLAGLQFILFLFFVPETLWNEDEPGMTGVEVVRASRQNSTENDKSIEQQIEMTHRGQATLPTGHVGSAWMPWSRPGEFFWIFISPILMLRYVSITLPSIYYGMVFGWGVGTTIVMPQLFDKPPYSFGEIALGCAFLAFGIGTLLGKWSGGIVGDKTVQYFERKHGSRQPEQRLWALLPILPLMFIGMLIIGISIVKELHWIAYLVGGAIFFFCISVATGILQTYVLECFIPRSMDTQAVFVFWKCIWGFVVPLFVYEWGQERGFLGEYIAQGVLSTGVGAIICLGLIWKGWHLRSAQGMPVNPR